MTASRDSAGTSSARARDFARRFVKPVIGEKAWRYLGDQARAQQKVRKERQRAQQWAATSQDLTALAKHFKTDKYGSHFYTPHYQTHFQHLREKPIRLLEIGIGGYSRAGQGGNSLRMWKHFFPNGQIVGLDIEDKSFVEEDRIKVYQGDQSDPELLARINKESGPFDIIIDDGSHRVWHVLPSFEALFPMLVDGGYYVIEDVQSSYWPEWGGSEDLNSPETTMALAKRLTDSLNYEEYVTEGYQPTYYDKNVVAVHFYHNLVIVEKGRNEEGSNKTRALRARYAKPETPAK